MLDFTDVAAHLSQLLIQSAILVQVQFGVVIESTLILLSFFVNAADFPKNVTVVEDFCLEEVLQSRVIVCQHVVALGYLVLYISAR